MKITKLVKSKSKKQRDNEQKTHTIKTHEDNKACVLISQLKTLGNDISQKYNEQKTHFK